MPVPSVAAEPASGPGIAEQLGLTVTGITPVGLASSAGSTPLRLRVEGGPQEYLFGKLYTWCSPL
jgi:hypothetical protein